MAIRTKGRSRVNVRGRAFVYWMHNDGEYLKIASVDKKFLVAYERCCYSTQVGPLLGIAGAEFPGVTPDEPRPVWIVPPHFEHAYSLKGLAKRIVEWSFDANHQLVRAASHPPRFPH